LGSLEQMRFGRQAVELCVGDRVLFQTDAVLDVVNDEGQPLGISRLKRFLARHLSSPPNELLTAVLEYGLAYGGLSAYPDDATLILMEVTGP
jgi:serine phosphatase RsbU (regulator of sigma subunit)